MSDNNWDDQQIENLLKQVPDIQDHRSKSEILARLKQDERLQIVKKKKRTPGWIPASVAVAALLLLSLLLPSMLPGNESQMDKAMEYSRDGSENKAEMHMEEAATHDKDDSVGFSGAAEDAAELELFDAKEDSGMSSHVLVPGELDGIRTFRIGLTYAADLIPVTFLIPEERIVADFPKGEPSSVELYNRYASEIPEEELGFDDYHPYKGELTLENNMIIHKVPEGHGYDLASARYGVYEKSIDETFTDYDTFKTVDENGNLAEFANVGMTDVKTLLKGKRQLPYYKYVMPAGESYLIPDGGESFKTVEEALVAMKEVPNDFVESLIPASIDFDVQVADGGGVAVITFKEQVDLSQINQEDANAMIEGLMLTAQSFHMVTRFENVLQTKFGKYDLTSNLPEPVAVNPLTLFLE